MFQQHRFQQFCSGIVVIMGAIVGLGNHFINAAQIGEIFRRYTQRLCGQIRTQGGVCFVRANAGDASIRWAARYANPRQRNA